MSDEPGTPVQYRASWKCSDYPACEGISTITLPWPQTPSLRSEREGCGCRLQWVWRQPEATEKKRKKKKR